ncbi:MAG: hypothetical protein AAF743_03055 [Planctomycetota bacterium]
MSRSTTSLLIAVVALLALGVGRGLEPRVLDTLDDASGFFGASEASVVNVEDGAVALGKADPDADAFVRWGLPEFQAVPMPTGGGLEVVISEVRGDAALQVLVQLEGPDGSDFGHFPWIDGATDPGPLTLEDLAAFAEEHGHPDAAAFRLLFRHLADPAGEIIIDEIRLTGGPST